ncbi:hypothetical protein ML401_34970 (plasmid) [Bradyrhizobium sp. 62B]|uniref:hypothetical protein n=1 Tax=Bradyrhizobium sp. 62B TaxID=2898442 RepID=UPI002557D739|nr:hypothetical protein ML401_34970 [Bradyrhizobium sp. 62B]
MTLADALAIVECHRRAKDAQIGLAEVCNGTGLSGCDILLAKQVTPATRLICKTLCRSKVSFAIAESMRDERHGPEAIATIRGLIEKIVLVPDEKGEGLLIDL